MPAAVSLLNIYKLTLGNTLAGFRLIQRSGQETATMKNPQGSTYQYKYEIHFELTQDAFSQDVLRKTLANMIQNEKTINYRGHCYDVHLYKISKPIATTLVVNKQHVDVVSFHLLGVAAYRPTITLDNHDASHLPSSSSS